MEPPTTMLELSSSLSDFKRPGSLEPSGGFFGTLRVVSQALQRWRFGVVCTSCLLYVSLYASAMSCFAVHAHPVSPLALMSIARICSCVVGSSSLLQRRARSTSDAVLVQAAIGYQRRSSMNCATVASHASSTASGVAHTSGWSAPFSVK